LELLARHAAVLFVDIVIAANCHSERSEEESRNPARQPRVMPRGPSTSLGMTGERGGLLDEIFRLRSK
jgi:hypothetical protein